MNLIKLILKSLCNTEYYVKRIESLTSELTQCIGPINITQNYKTKINPHRIIKGYDMKIADIEYVTYTIDDWKDILAQLHHKLVDKYEWTTDVYDCDDIALLYSSTMAYSAYKSGLRKQPTFAIAWSNVHAFNLFIDSNNNVWIFEPQSGTIKGNLGDDLGEMYAVKKIWFMV